MIYPYTSTRKYWEYFMYTLCTLVASELPFEWLIGGPMIIWYVIPALFIDLFFFIDIYIFSHTGILEYGIIQKNKNIPKKKIIFMIFASMPWYLIGYVLKSDIAYRALTALKLLRMPRFIEASRLITETRFFDTSIGKIYRMFLLYFIFISINASIWWLCGHLEQSTGTSWLIEDGFDKLSKYWQVFYAYYVITMSSISIGYGDIVAVTIPEMLIYIEVDFLGVFYYNLIGTVFIQLFKDTPLHQKVHDVLNRFNWRQVPKETRNETYRYFDYMWEKNQDIIDFYSFGGEFPDSLKTKIAGELHTPLLRKTGIYERIDVETLKDLTMVMRPKVLAPGFIFTKPGQISDSIFLLSSGLVNVLNSHGSKILTLNGEDGVIIGEQSLVSRAPEVTCMIAVSYINCYEIIRSDFEEIPELANAFLPRSS